MAAVASRLGSYLLAGCVVGGALAGEPPPVEPAATALAEVVVAGSRIPVDAAGGTASAYIQLFALADSSILRGVLSLGQRTKAGRKTYAAQTAGQH